MSLEQLGSLFGGLSGKVKADFSEGNAPYVPYKAIYNHAAVDLCALETVQVADGENQRTLHRGDVLFTASSETAEDVGMTSVMTIEPLVPIYLNSFSIVFRPSDPSMIDPEYTKHVFRSSQLRRQIVRTASGVTRFNVSKRRLSRVAVPLPPLAEQRRIASHLDALDALLTDLSIGLPAELAARRKQYEYYRDHLLTFAER